MLSCENFYNLLIENNIDFFAGVPDSLLKDFCAYIFDNTSDERNIIAANEGNAVALAVGYHLATSNIGLVYMQNSGQGNVINPLASLTDREVYSIPLLMVIGWRGEPNQKDEPQHVKQGKITLSLLDTMGISYDILPDKIDNAKKILLKAVNIIKSESVPYALIVRKGTFEEYNLKKVNTNVYDLTREEAVKAVVDKLGENDIIVSTTGKTSRELYEYREENGQDHSRDFLTVGSMGHCSQIALGIALSKKDSEIYCFDGDGALIMHMGSLAIAGAQDVKNFKHIVFNNGAHDSVGGQPTVGLSIDFPGIAKACGYKSAYCLEKRDDFDSVLNQFISSNGPAFLEIKVKKGSRKDLGRPATSPEENKKQFMHFLQSIQ